MKEKKREDHHRCGVFTHPQPRLQIPRKRERDLALRADGGVDGERVQRVHGGIVDGPDDPGRADNVPRRRGVGLAVVEQEVFLRVVEVGLERDAGVGFEERRAGGTEVDAVIFRAGLEQDAGRVERGEWEGVDEIAEEGS